MRRAAPVLCVLALVATPSAQMRGVDTVRGLVVDLASALEFGAAAADGARAAAVAARARDGQPMAIVADDGVYVVEGGYTDQRNAKLLDFVGRRAEAKGTIGERDGRQTINVTAMMVEKPGPPERRPPAP